LHPLRSLLIIHLSKVVSSGKTVSNYNSLVSEIQSKRATVSTALTKAQNDATAFSCTADDPKGQLTWIILTSKLSFCYDVMNDPWI